MLNKPVLAIAITSRLSDKLIEVQATYTFIYTEAL